MKVFIITGGGENISDYSFVGVWMDKDDAV